METVVYDVNGNQSHFEVGNMIFRGGVGFNGQAKTSDYTLQNCDLYVGVDASSGNVTITVPDVSALYAYEAHWFVKRMDDSSNEVIVQLEVPSDSQYGSNFSSITLTRLGSGIEILKNANGKYIFASWDGIQNPLAPPSVTTKTPSLASTTLTMKGQIESLGSNSQVTAFFRYRDETTGGSWVETTETIYTATGEFTDTATVTAGDVYAVQAVVKDEAGTRYYGSVLETSVNYYSDTTEAQMDGLVWGSRIQEGTGSTSADVFGNYDITWTGITWSSDTINGQTVYKADFGSNDYGEAGFAPTFSSESYTILIQIKADLSSGDHTYLNFGRNIVSVGSDQDDIQLEIRNSLAIWYNNAPLTSITNLFIIIDRSAGKSQLYATTASADSLKATYNGLPSSDAAYTRIARGSNGDSNHQDYEYLDSGSVRSIWIWKRVLSSSERIDICNILDTDGGQVV